MVRKIAFSLACLLLSCSTQAGNINDGASGAGGNLGQQGCTSDPDCGSCDSCYAHCVCQTGNQVECKPACGLGGGTGSGGASATGGASGSSGATSSGGAAASGGTGGSGGTLSTGGTGGQPSSLPLVANLKISQVAIYQSVKIPLMQQGSAVTNRNAPVVTGRQAMLRVFVAPESGWQSRTVVGELDLSGAAPITAQGNISAASSDASLQSTINFDIPAQDITGSTTYAISLHEASAVAGGGDTSGAKYPAQGSAQLGASSDNGALQIKLVPITVGGYTPLSGASQVKALHDRLMAMYPVAQITMTVRSPYNYSSDPNAVQFDGTGWSDVLNALLSLRQNDHVNSKIFYYGMLAPLGSLQGYTQGYNAWVAGLGPIGQASDNFSRGSVGLGYFQDGSGGPTQQNGGAPDTMAHEFAHALGRPHSPCGTTDAPPGYPYPNGEIGDWGYDVFAKALKNPTQYKDMMGYCQPVWISDYTYKPIFDRISYVNANGAIVLPPGSARTPGPYRVALLGDDGSLRWGTPVDLDSSPFGQARQVATLDAKGNVIGTVTGYFYRVDRGTGGMLLLHDDGTLSAALGVSAIELPGSSLLNL